ncbi:hypothetical protein [Proteus mirabilis]|uniref:hypothetical protein n=4 Tax=Proteus mirabilis TaxID=584 RepID=UPI001B9F5DC7|nr:hypothetical protein [Proteus mirabilis]HBC8684743.1 hypothetical protein [Proteus mirabilis]HEK1907203.1 hypothetical protein [Proteus mirabilis]HEK3013142.1 hypothetical protein [Proteus mirabilis]
MTVSTELSHEEYVGNGVTTDFDFRFRIFESKHLIVVVADSEGNETTLKNGTDYTIVGAGSYHGGKVVLNKPLVKGWKILLERDLPVVQETDLRNQGKFFAEVHEDAFDYLTMLIQKALGTFSLSLRKPTYLSNYYDAKGNRISNIDNPKNKKDAVNKEYLGEYVSNYIINYMGDCYLSPIGLWERGKILSKQNQIVMYNNEWYLYRGVLPHELGDDPRNDGGIWSPDNPEGKWVSIIKNNPTIFDLGGNIEVNESCFYEGFYYKNSTKNKITITPNTKPDEYNLINIGSLKYSPDYNILNFNGDFYHALKMSEIAYGKCYIGDIGQIEMDKPYFSESKKLTIIGNETKILYSGDSTIKHEGIYGKIGLFDTRNKEGDIIFIGCSFDSKSKLNSPYIYTLLGHYRAYNCVFKNSKYCCFKSSNRESNGTISADGVTGLYDCITKTDNGPIAYGNGTNWYKSNNKTRFEIKDSIIDSTEFTHVSSGMGISIECRNEFFDSSSPYYVLPAYYLESDDSWDKRGVNINKNIVSGNGKLVFNNNLFFNNPCAIYVISDGDISISVNSSILSKNNHNVFYSKVNSLSSFEININGVANITHICILSLNSSSKPFVAYTNRLTSINNRYLNLSRGVTAGIDSRNILIDGNYILGCGYPISIDTVSYGGDGNTFTHNITNCIVSNNVVEHSISHVWYTGSCGEIKNNRFSMCGYFSDRETGVLINSKNSSNSFNSGILLSDNTFVNHIGRVVQVTSGTCFIGLNFHDSIYTLKNQIYSCVNGANLVFLKRQTLEVSDKSFDLNNGFENYIIDNSLYDEVTVNLPSLTYGKGLYFSYTLIVKNPEKRIKIQALNQYSSINGKNSETITGKRMITIFNSSNSNDFYSS